jgi:hypothetical protein
VKKSIALIQGTNLTSHREILNLIEVVKKAAPKIAVRHIKEPSNARLDLVVDSPFTPNEPFPATVQTLMYKEAKPLLVIANARGNSDTRAAFAMCLEEIIMNFELIYQ